MNATQVLYGHWDVQAFAMEVEKVACKTFLSVISLTACGAALDAVEKTGSTPPEDPAVRRLPHWIQIFLAGLYSTPSAHSAAITTVKNWQPLCQL